MATRSELRKEFRTLLNQVGTSWINDSTDALLMTVDDLLWQAYRHVSKELECFRLHNLGIETIADQEFYEFGAFGYHAEELEKIVESEAANDTTTMTPTVAEVVLTLRNETGGVSTGNSATYTVAGTNAVGTAITEVLTFDQAVDLTAIADDATVAKTTTATFATVSSIAVSAAQPAGWSRYAGIASGLEKFVPSQAADNASAMTPPITYVPEWRVAISLINETGGADDGNLATYTVTGRNWAGRTISEALVFTAAELAALDDDEVVTHYTSGLFATVTSITCSAAQPALWSRYAGVAEINLGARVFRPISLHYDDKELTRLTMGRVLGSNRSFRGMASGVPGQWDVDSENVIRMVRPTTAGSDLYLDGFAYPDEETFDEDTHEPAFDADDHSLIPLWAAVLTTIRDPETPNDARASVFWVRWTAELAKAKARRKEVGSATIEIGRYAFARSHRHSVDEDSLTLA